MGKGGAKADQRSYVWIPALLGITGWIVTFNWLSGQCTWHGVHALSVLLPVPPLAFATYCCWRVLMVYWQEAGKEGGWEVYYTRFGKDRFDVVIVGQFLFWCMAVYGYVLMLLPPPLAQNCEYRAGLEMAGYEFTPCRACCGCLELIQDTNALARCGFDYCDQELRPDADSRIGGYERRKELGLLAANAQPTSYPTPRPPTPMPTQAPTPAADSTAATTAAALEVRPPALCWGTGLQRTDALLRQTLKSKNNKCDVNPVWYNCIFQNCMEALGPKFAGGVPLTTAVAAYPTCRGNCKYKPSYLSPPVYNEYGRGEYDVYESTPEQEHAAVCKPMCYNDPEIEVLSNPLDPLSPKFLRVASNTILVDGKKYNYTDPVPPVDTRGIELLVLGIFFCISLVGCFTTCFKGHAATLRVGPERASQTGDALSDGTSADETKGENKLLAEIAAMKTDVVGQKKAETRAALRKVPLVGDPAVDHLDEEGRALTDKGRRTLAQLHKERALGRAADGLGVTAAGPVRRRGGAGGTGDGGGNQGNQAAGDGVVASAAGASAAGAGAGDGGARPRTAGGLTGRPLTAIEGAILGRRPVRPSSLRVAEVSMTPVATTSDEALEMEDEEKRRRSQTEYI